MATEKSSAPTAPLPPDFDALAAVALRLKESGRYQPPTRSENVYPVARIEAPNVNGLAVAALEVLRGLATFGMDPWVSFLSVTIESLIRSCEIADAAGDRFFQHPIAVERLASAVLELLAKEHAGLHKARETYSTIRRAQPDGDVALLQARAMALARDAGNLTKRAKDALNAAGAALGGADPKRQWQWVRADAVRALVAAFESNDSYSSASAFFMFVTSGNESARVEELASVIEKLRARGKDVEAQIRAACRHISMSPVHVKGLFNFEDESAKRKARAAEKVTRSLAPCAELVPDGDSVKSPRSHDAPTKPPRKDVAPSRRSAGETARGRSSRGPTNDRKGVARRPR
jgi:hypothetical protein